VCRKIFFDQGKFGERHGDVGSDLNGTYLSQNVGWVSVFCVTHQSLRSNMKRLLMCAYGTLGGLRRKQRASPTLHFYISTARSVRASLSNAALTNV
jgi:hypothetical protein